MRDVTYDAAAQVLLSRRLAEFVDPPNLLQMQSSQEKRQQSAILAVKMTGNCTWYLTLQPFTSRCTTTRRICSKFDDTTSNGGHFGVKLCLIGE
jgi:hypothetical protein